MDKNTFLQEEYHISPQVMDLVERIGADIKPQLDTLMERAEMHQYRVIRAMQRAGLSDRHFHPATGYGYDDVGREIVEAIYADVFGAEDALVVNNNAAAVLIARISPRGPMPFPSVFTACCARGMKF